MPNKPRAILLGAGHAHLEVARCAPLFHERGYELLLISPGPFWYSGLATGMLGGRYPAEQDQVDAGRLVERGGGSFIAGRGVRIDVHAREVHLDDGRVLPYDVLSLNLGSEVPTAGVPGIGEFAVPVKPVENLWRLRMNLDDRLRTAGSERPVRVLVAGGGASGCEVAANLKRGHSSSQRQSVMSPLCEVTLVTSADRLLGSFGRGAGECVRRVLEERGVRVQTGAALVRVERDAAWLADGRRLEFDLLVAATGLEPPALLRSTGLPTAEDGSLLVDRTLHSVADARVFGAGDCVALSDQRIARVGVYAVRMAPILTANLLATLGGSPLRTFRPQRRFLLILNLGDGTGLATWGPLYGRGRLAFWLKDRIDRRYLRKYQNLLE